MKRILLSLIALAPVPVLAQTLTTATPDNWNNAPLTVYMDLTALQKDLPVTAFDTYAAKTGAEAVDVYLCTGSYVSNQTTASAWTRIDSYSTTVTDISVPVTIDLSSPIQLTKGQVQGIAFVFTSGTDRYVNGETTVANADLSMYSADVHFGAFSGGHGGRGFGGTIHYGAVPEPTTLAVLSFGGLAFLRRKKRAA